MLRWTNRLTFGTAIVLALVGHLAWTQSAPTQDWTQLDREAEQLYTRGALKEAIRVETLALDAASTPVQSAHSMDRLGFFEYTSGDMKQGESFLRRALEIRKSNPGVETADYSESANDLALFYRDSGKLPQARQFAEQAVAIRERVLPPGDLRVAESLNTLGSIYGLSGEYELAISRFEQARALHESHVATGDLGEEYGTLCVNLAGTYQRVGNYAKADEIFERGLDVLRRRPGINHPAYSASLVAYAYLQADLGHYSKAEKLYEESGRLMREQLGERHPYYATYLNNRAALYAALGNVTVAETDYRKSLNLKRSIYGPDALTVGASLRNLAGLISSRDPEEGARLFRQAVDLYSRNPKPPPFDYASALLGLANAQRKRGALAAARETLQQASQVVTQGLGAKHPLYAAVLLDLGQVHRAAHEYVEAEQKMREAITIVTETHGDHHPDLAKYLENLAAVYDEAGDAGAALPLYVRSLDIGDESLSEMLAIGSESSKGAVLTSRDDLIPELISFQRRVGDRLPAARALAFEAVARRKGRILDEVHDWGQTLRDNADPAIRTRFAEWQALLECQSSLTLALGYRDLKPAVLGTCALPGTELAHRYERLLHDLRTNWTETLNQQALEALNSLKQRRDTLEAALSRDLPQIVSAIRPPGWEDMRSHLAPDEALLELVQYTDMGTPESNGDKPGYGAFFLTHNSDVEWADLGPAGPIDRAVQDLITAANDWSVSLADHEVRAARSSEKTAEDALRILSAQLHPIVGWLVQFPGVHRVRFAPDGLLSLIPFGALSDGRGRYLIENYIISYVSAGRDLASPSAKGQPGNPPVIAVSPGPQASSPNPGRRIASAFRTERLERLTDADAEARDIRRRLPKAQLLGEREATEQRLKQFHSPALLHIIGHGIVRGAEDCQSAPATPDCQLTTIEPAARVMSLSAIVLEEAYGRGTGSQQDGLLTALELQTLDLQSSEMLVLSQCRMADGVPSSGEGVFGMRRAAAIAGVKTFVAPMWNVADITERVLMNRFYRELSAGKSRAAALRQAQLQLLRSPATASVLQWAPVILSGDPGPLPRDLIKK